MVRRTAVGIWETQLKLQKESESDWKKIAMMVQNTPEDQQKKYYAIMSITDIGQYIGHYIGQVIYSSQSFEDVFQKFIWQWINNRVYHTTELNMQRQYILVVSPIEPEVLSPQLVINSEMLFFRLFINKKGKTIAGGRPGRIFKKIVKKSATQRSQVATTTSEMITKLDQLGQQILAMSKDELLETHGYQKWYHKLWYSKEQLQNDLLYQKLTQAYEEIYKSNETEH